MVVGFVNAGLLPLAKAIGVILGANIGTTVTIAHAFGQARLRHHFCRGGPDFLIGGKRPSLKMQGQIFMGLGVCVIGMKTMTGAMEPMQSWEGFAA
jgi:phosphate:Na+ symporter